MNCRKCGCQNSETARYCVHCGKKLKQKKPEKKKTYLVMIALCAMVLGLATGLFLAGRIHHEVENSSPAQTTYPADSTLSVQTSTEPATYQTEDPMEIAYQSAVTYCEELGARRAYAEAIEYLKRISVQHKEDSRYDALSEQYEKLLCNDLLESAADLTAEGQYRQAIQMLSDAWEEYPFDELQEAASRFRREFGVYNTSTITAGKFNTMVLKPDGSIDVTGDRSQDEYDAGQWSDIVAISAGDRHIMGLTSTGSVVACGKNDVGQCNVSSWKDAVAISAGDVHSVALLEDGTVLAEGYNWYKQCDVNSLMQAAGRKRIVSISAGYVQTLALLEDGTVVACGDNQYGACNVGSWADISAIYTGTQFSVGLKNDGTVAITGKGISDWGVAGWTDIINIAAGDYFLIGLRSDGTVVSAGFSDPKINQWRDIRFIAAGHDHVAAIDAAGNIYCAGKNDYNQCAFHGKTLY